MLLNGQPPICDLYDNDYNRYICMDTCLRSYPTLQYKLLLLRSNCHRLSFLSHRYNNAASNYCYILTLFYSIHKIVLLCFERKLLHIDLNFLLSIHHNHFLSKSQNNYLFGKPVHFFQQFAFVFFFIMIILSFFESQNPCQNKD